MVVGVEGAMHGRRVLQPTALGAAPRSPFRRPTRLGRHGTLLTRSGPLKIFKSVYRNDYRPVDEACDGYVSTSYSRAYLHHLWKAHEPAVHGLLTLHNLKFMADFCLRLRQKIMRGEI